MSNAFQQTRSILFDWAARHHPAALKEGVDLYFGGEPRSEDAAYAAIAFALATPPAGGASLTERYAAENAGLPRAQRSALEAWSRGRFGLYEVAEVVEDQGLTLVDVFTEAQCWVREKSATHQLVPGDWLAAFVVPVGGHHELEGTLEVVMSHTRLPAVQAAIATLDVPAAEPSRRAARPVIRAIREASARHRASPVGTTALAADTSVEALGGLTPRAALDAGRGAEVRALLPVNPLDRATLCAELGLAPIHVVRTPSR